MRTGTIVILILAISGAYSQDWVLQSDTSASLNRCSVSSNTCGSCLTFYSKTYLDAARGLVKVDRYCSRCGTGKRLDSSPSTYTRSNWFGTVQDTYKYDLASKCIPV